MDLARFSELMGTVFDAYNSRDIGEKGVMVYFLALGELTDRELEESIRRVAQTWPHASMPPPGAFYQAHKKTNPAPLAPYHRPYVGRGNLHHQTRGLGDGLECRLPDLPYKPDTEDLPF